MYEFHGWLMVDGAVDGTGQIDDRLTALVGTGPDDFGTICELRLTSNNLLVLVAHGMRNRCHEPVLRIFKGVAGAWPESYGLLYIRDENDAARSNEFQVFRFARGIVEALPDPFLSPCIPVIEPPHDESADSEED